MIEEEYDKIMLNSYIKTELEYNKQLVFSSTFCLLAILIYIGIENYQIGSFKWSGGIISIISLLISLITSMSVFKLNSLVCIAILEERISTHLEKYIRKADGCSFFFFLLGIITAILIIIF